METRSPASTFDLLAACALTPAGGNNWNQLVSGLAPRIRRGVLGSLAGFGEKPTPELVDDLVQEVWCHLLADDRRRCRGFRGDSDLAAGVYLRRLVRGVVVDALRAGSARKRRPRSLISLGDVDELDWAPADRAGCPEQRLLARERLRHLLVLCRRAVGRKAPRQRLRIARLGLIEGWSSSEIAAVLPGSVSHRSIDSTLFRIRRRLRQLGVRLPRRPGGGAAR